MSEKSSIITRLITSDALKMEFSGNLHIIAELFRFFREPESHYKLS